VKTRFVIEVWLVCVPVDMVRVSSRTKLGGDWAKATDRQISRSPAVYTRTRVTHIARMTGGMPDQQQYRCIVD